MRPNVLLLMVDQLAAGWLPAYGHDVVQAPHLDALARESVVFDSAYCASPLCAPSRAALLTGKLPSRTGVYDNAAELPASEPTIAHRLRVEGYRTCLAGKMHFLGPDQLHGFEERLTTDIYPAGLEWTPDWERPLDDPLPWYHTMEAVRTPAVAHASMQLDYDDEVAFHAVRRLHDLARDGPQQPFFLTVSFTHPHDPWELRAAHWDRYDRAAIDLPAVPPIPLEQADPHSRRLRAMSGIDRAGLTDEEVRAARHAYYAAISYVDERIGEVLATLRDLGLDEHTIVVFTADHGELLGERGLWYKMSFFEPSARVPLFIRFPGGRSARVADPVSQLDLLPTIADLTGLRGAVEGGDGASLAPLLGEPATRRPGAVYAEYLAEGVTAPAVMIRRGRHKFVHCDGDPDQLYDLEADPVELDDLATSPGHRDLVEAFRREVAERWDLEDLRRRVLTSQARRHLVARALRVGRYEPWDFQPRVDAAAQYVRNRDDLYEQQRRARLVAGPATA
jgi:choline-sulfatase